MNPQNPFFGFPLSPDLARDLSQTLTQARAAPLKKPFALPLYELIARLSEEGLGYFFIATLKAAKVNALSLKAIEMALHTGQKAVLSLGKTLLKNMSESQLEVVIERMAASFCESQPL